MKKALALVVVALVLAGCAMQPTNTGAAQPVPAPGIAAGTVKPQTDLLPPDQLEGWQIDKYDHRVTAYDRENLYLLMPDKADLYARYGLVELTHAVYRYKLLGKASVLVNIAQMDSPLHAYGLWSVERDRSAPAADFGGGAQKSGKELDFWKGDYFVTITLINEVDNPGEALDYFAKNIAERIEGETSIPQLSWFPKDNRVPAGDSYYVSDLLGYKVLGHGFTVKYNVTGGTATMFLATFGSNEAANTAWLKLREQLQGAGDRPAVLPGPWRAAYSANEKKLGPGLVALQGPYVAGILGTSDGDLARSMLAELVKNIK